MSPPGATAGHFSPISSSEGDVILPPLPEVQSEQISKRIFTHSSLAGNRGYDFQAPESDPSTDNEELGHIGDQVFGLAMTDLIQKLRPHLQVGPASKMRDYVKRRSLLAEICVSYGLQKRLHLLENRAGRLRTSERVQAAVFKAYVGGVYRDQGMEVVSKWLTPLFQPHVEAAYRDLRKVHLLPPESAAAQQPGTSTAHYPSPPPFTPQEGARPALPIHLGGDPSELRRTIPLQANVPQQGLGQPLGDNGAPPRTMGRRRRRRRYTDGTRFERRSSIGSDTAESARKRPRGDAV
ncbi:ribonuclease III domain-containing protein [Russula compacta]|nr:ribonuclease III domain-containing protein [Russula compacta]